jgi:hypothetical protein
MAVVDGDDMTDDRDSHQVLSQQQQQQQQHPEKRGGTLSSRGSSGVDRTKTPVSLPVRCVFVPQLQLFQITQMRGKALSSGGFGVVLSSENAPDGGGETVEQDTGAATDKAGGTRNSAATAATRSQEYLFIEEVIFLHERGLVEVFFSSPQEGGNEDTDEDTANSPPASIDAHVCDATTAAPKTKQTQRHHQQPLQSHELYSLLLPACGLSLSAYLVYAHLRAQEFRVVRHTPSRRRILQDMTIMQRVLRPSTDDTVEADQEAQQLSACDRSRSENREDCVVPANDNSTCGLDRSATTTLISRTLAQLKLELRQDASAALAPAVYYQQGPCDDDNDNGISSCSAAIAFDIYEPNSGFCRSNPGLPDYYAVATFYNTNKIDFGLGRSSSGTTTASSTSVRFSHLQQLLKIADGIPLRVATVSDAGTVILFGVTDHGAPDIGFNKTTKCSHDDFDDRGE